MLLITKGVYPYEYMDSYERFNENKLPPKKWFCSKLNKQHISDKDYEHAQKVWSTFNIKNRILSWSICASRYIATIRHIRRF